MKTIAELRMIEVKRLASLREGSTEEEASRIMNSYYRLCGLCEKNLILQNDARLCDRLSTKRSEEKETRWDKRLNEALKPYNLVLDYFGYLPTICEAGTTRQAINTYFYN